MKLFTIIKSNSERIPNKNFQLISKSLPLWKWTINKLRSKENKIFINTDSEDVLNEIENDDDIVGIKRSEKHIMWEKNSKNQGSPVESMYKEFCEKYTSNQNEKVCLFHVTSPFINFETIKNASAYLDKGFDSVQSVKKIQDFVFFNDNGNLKPINFNPDLVQRTQDLVPIYISLGAFFLGRSGEIIKTGRRLPGRCFNYKLNSIESIEIDEYDQLELSRIVAKSLK